MTDLTNDSTPRVYLAGPMRGIPEFNFPAFHSAARYLRSMGYVVFSPAERDNERLGTDVSKGNATGNEAQAAAEHGFSLRDALGEDLEWICKHATHIAVLPDWERSRGARAEKSAGEALDLSVMYLARVGQTWRVT